jgi:hypothetical protein
MEQRRISFDELWEQEERKGLLKRMQDDYPVWQRRRHTRRVLLASVSVLLVVGFSIFNFQFSITRDYDYVCCNRSDIPDGHWAEVAGNILTIETL